MYKIETSRKFRKAFKRYKNSGRFNEGKLRIAIELLRNGKKLPAVYKDHSLKGTLSPYQECHIEPGLLLIYTIERYILILVLVNLGPHAELFGK